MRTWYSVRTWREVRAQPPPHVMRHTVWLHRTPHCTKRATSRAHIAHALAHMLRATCPFATGPFAAHGRSGNEPALSAMTVIDNAHSHRQRRVA